MVELTTQMLIPSNILWLPLCRIYKFGLNTLPSKTVAIPYTCGLSRPFSGAVAGEHSYICSVTWDYYHIITMKNLKDPKTKIFPLKTRGGKELPSSSALDSPSVMSKLATPPHAIHSTMSPIIDDATLLKMMLMMMLVPCLIMIMCHLVIFLLNKLLELCNMMLSNLMMNLKLKLLKHLLELALLDMNCLRYRKVML